MFNVKSRYVYVNPPYLVRPFFRRVHSRDRLFKVVHDLRERAELPHEQKQALLTDPLARFHLLPNLIHRERGSRHRLVVSPECAIKAIVHALIRHVQRREKHEPSAIDLLFHPACSMPHLREEIRVLDHQKARDFLMGEPVQLLRPIQYLVDLRSVGRPG
ncbi:MAG: hypothetical protein BWY06_03323 [Candidatus Latescibacteria bacterium ADurb.Bin168]|nr:MAG: hypothetical protein BWY06_03323 [Candidatus Latescibacteria bacterium ADurb.Bin168]